MEDLFRTRFIVARIVVGVGLLVLPAMGANSPTFRSTGVGESEPAPLLFSSFTASVEQSAPANPVPQFPPRLPPFFPDLPIIGSLPAPQHATVAAAHLYELCQRFASFMSGELAAARVVDGPGGYPTDDQLSAVANRGPRRQLLNSAAVHLSGQESHVHRLAVIVTNLGTIMDRGASILEEAGKIETTPTPRRSRSAWDQSWRVENVLATGPFRPRPGWDRIGTLWTDVQIVIQFFDYEGLRRPLPRPETFEQMRAGTPLDMYGPSTEVVKRVLAYHESGVSPMALEMVKKGVKQLLVEIPQVRATVTDAGFIRSTELVARAQSLLARLTLERQALDDEERELVAVARKLDHIGAILASESEHLVAQRAAIQALTQAVASETSALESLSDSRLRLEAEVEARRVDVEARRDALASLSFQCVLGHRSFVECTHRDQQAAHIARREGLIDALSHASKALVASRAKLGQVRAEIGKAAPALRERRRHEREAYVTWAQAKADLSRRTLTHRLDSSENKRQVSRNREESDANAANVTQATEAAAHADAVWLKPAPANRPLLVR